MQPRTGDSQVVRPPLNSVNDIRVIIIERSIKHDDPVRCRFRITSLDRPIPYCTLSYAWVPISADESHLDDFITCDGRRFPTTSHLTSALKRIRQVSETELQRGNSHRHWQFVVWVDAICINQDNVAERSSQVQMMHRIFESSQQLFFWLGNPSHELNNTLRELKWRGLIGYKDDPIASWDPLQFTREVNTKSATSKYNDAFRSRFCRQVVETLWFRRRWVIQEVLMSTGPKTILLGECIIVHHYNIEHIASPLRNWLLRGPKGQPLLTLLQLHSRAECSDPRDRVYALHNLSTDLADLKVDYTQDASGVFYRVATNYLESLNLSVLLDCAASRKHFPRQEPGQTSDGLVMPSWVPNWASQISGNSRHGSSPYPNPKEKGDFGVYEGKLLLTTNRDLVLEGWIFDYCDQYPPKGHKIVHCFYCDLATHHTYWGHGVAGAKASFAFLPGVSVFFALREIHPQSSSRRKFNLCSSMGITTRTERVWDIENSDYERVIFELS